MEGVEGGEGGSVSADLSSTQSLVLKHAPIRRGHFLLGSGMHTPYYVELETIAQDPSLATTICQAIAERFRTYEPQAVLAVLGPDAVLGFELARQLAARALFADGPLGRRSLRSAFRAKPEERVLILIGVIVTGESARELIRLVRSTGGRPVGVAVLIDRSGARLELGVPTEALAIVDLEAHFAPVCPLCAAGQPLERRQD